MATHAISTLPFWLMVTGFAIATVIYMSRPGIADALQNRFPFLYRLLDNKYYFDEFYLKFFAQGSVNLGRNLWNKADAGFIDNGIVNGSARVVGWISGLVRLFLTTRIDVSATWSTATAAFDVAELRRGTERVAGIVRDLRAPRVLLAFHPRRQRRPQPAAGGRYLAAPRRQHRLAPGAGHAPGRALLGVRRVRAGLPDGHPAQPAQPQDGPGAF